MSRDEQGEKESPILASIRNFMMSHGGLGGAENREFDVAMGVDSSSDTAKGYAFGGEVMPDLGDVPIPGQQPQSVPRATAAPPVVAQSPIQGILAQSQGLGAQMAGQYTPEKRNELYAALLERQNSMPNAIGMGLSSVGDAIARGYGHDQTNFLDKTMQGQKQGLEQGLGAFDTAQKMTMAQTGAGMELGKMDPSSVISKIYQDSYSGPLKKLGYSEEQISKMSAANIEPVTQVGLKYGDIQAQKELKEATLELTAKMNEAQIANMKAGQQTRSDEVKRQQEESNKNLDVEASKHWIMHPVLAHQAATRLASGSAGAGAARAAQVPTFATEADAEKANLPDGTRIKIGDQTGTWRHK